jgi:hypothetical protein
MATRKIATTINSRGRKFYRSAMAILLIAWIPFTSFSGCGSRKKTPTPEQKEQQRQKMIENAKRQQREG